MSMLVDKIFKSLQISLSVKTRVCENAGVEGVEVYPLANMEPIHTPECYIVFKLHETNGTGVMMLTVSGGMEVRT